jgi:CRP-like cAMP-binding protein
LNEPLPGWTTGPLSFPMKDFFNALVPLPEAVWEAVSAVAHPVRLAKKQVLLEPGQVCDRMYFLHTGAVRSYLLQDGLDITYFFFFADTFPFAVDFASFRTDQPSQYYLESIEPGEATSFFRRDIYDLYERYPEMQKFGRLMAEQAYLMMDRRMHHFQFHDLQTRYLALLREEGPLLQRVPQHLIATYLGVTPESLSRIRQRVVRTGH